MESKKLEPEYKRVCAYRDCPEVGHIYEDMLFPIRLCSQHAKARYGTFKSKGGKFTTGGIQKQAS